MYMNMVRMLADLLFFCSTFIKCSTDGNDDFQLFSQTQQQWLGSQNLKVISESTAIAVLLHTTYTPV